MSMKNILATTAVATLLAAGANAATATFNFNGSDSVNYNDLPSTNLIEQTVSGLTGQFSAGSFTSSPLGTQTTLSGENGYFINGANKASAPRIGAYSGGLGVANSPGEAHWVDGSGFNDYIQMNFSEEVTLDAMSFFVPSNADGDYRWIFDLNGDNEINEDDFIAFSDDDNPFAGAPSSLVSDTWGVMARNSDDFWKLSSVTVSYDDTPAVPLPAAGWMLIAGLGGMAAMKRRKKKS